MRLIAVMVTIVVLAGWGGREVLRFARMALEQVFYGGAAPF